MSITLNRPTAGQVVTVAASKEELSLALNFPLSEAVFERDGDNLVLSFDAGEKIVLENFYAEYTGKSIPDFEVDGATIAGEDFFKSLGDETLMPAAGGDGDSADGGRYYDNSFAALAGGVDALGAVAGGSEYGRFGDVAPGEVSGGAARAAAPEPEEETDEEEETENGGNDSVPEPPITFTENNSTAYEITATETANGYSGDKVKVGTFENLPTGAIVTVTGAGEYGVFSVDDGVLWLEPNTTSAGIINNLAQGQSFEKIVEGSGLQILVNDEPLEDAGISSITFNFTGSNDNADHVTIGEMNNGAILATNDLVDNGSFTITKSGENGKLDLGGGDDKLTATSMSGGRIEGGAGDDEITINGNMSATNNPTVKADLLGTATQYNEYQQHIFSQKDVDSFNKIDNKIIGGDGDDTITVAGEMKNANIVGNSVLRSDGKDGGDNTIVVGETGKTGTIISGNSNIFGDVDLTGTGTKGGNNTIVVNGDVNLTTTNMDSTNYVIGKEGIIAGQRNIADGAVGGDDNITINGNMLQGEILGEHNVFNGAQAGDDIIHIKGNVSGTNTYVAGEAIVTNAIAGSDKITIDGTVSGGSITGTYGLFADSVGGDNDITVGNVKAGTPGASTGLGYYNNVVAGVSVVDNSVAGNDKIVVTGDVTGGGVFGEAVLQNNAVGGDNTIEVKGTLSGGFVGGGYQVTNSQSGNDTITINNMTAGNVYGDAQTMTNSAGGNDTITITNLSGGNVYGDAQTMTNYIGGDDKIAVTNMSGGTINAGDGADKIAIATISGGIVNADAGNDEITVGAMSGGTINSGAGEDKVTVTGNMTKGTITTGADNDTVIVEGRMSSTNSSNTSKIDTGEGDDAVKVDSLFVGTNATTVAFNADSRAEISTGAGQDTIEIGTMYMGKISAGEGDDKITVDKMGYGTINGEGGNDKIDLDFYAGGTVDGGAGNDAIHIGKFFGGNQSTGIVFEGVTYTTAADKYTGSLLGGTGDDTITIDEFTNSNTTTDVSGNAITATTNGVFAQTIDGGVGGMTYLFTIAIVIKR